MKLIPGQRPGVVDKTYHMHRWLLLYNCCPGLVASTVPAAVMGVTADEAGLHSARRGVVVLVEVEVIVVVVLVEVEVTVVVVVVEVEVEVTVVVVVVLVEVEVTVVVVVVVVVKGAVVLVTGGVPARQRHCWQPFSSV